MLFHLVLPSWLPIHGAFVFLLGLLDISERASFLSSTMPSSTERLDHDLQDIVVNQLFGTVSGLGMSLVTFDWAQIAYIGSPLATPWWAEANVAVGFFTFFCQSISLGAPGR